MNLKKFFEKNTNYPTLTEQKMGDFRMAFF
jgi:hypothetical protein